jgi:hypothetical protein
MTTENPSTETSLSDDPGADQEHRFDNKQEAIAALAALLRLIVERYSNSPDVPIGELMATEATVNADVPDDSDTLPAPTETSTESSDNNADMSDTIPPPTETPTEPPDNNVKPTPDKLDPAVVAENSDLIMADIKAKIADLANATTDPEALTTGYERLFNEVLRVKVCVYLQDLLNNGGEELALAKTQYGAQFALLFDQLDI